MRTDTFAEYSPALGIPVSGSMSALQESHLQVFTTRIVLVTSAASVQSVLGRFAVFVTV